MSEMFQFMQQSLMLVFVIRCRYSFLKTRYECYVGGVNVVAKNV